MHQVLGVGHRQIDVHEDAFGALQKLLTGLGQRHLPGRAVDELQAHLGFQLAHQKTGCRLGQVQLAGRRREAGTAHHLHEGAQLSKRDI